MFLFLKLDRRGPRDEEQNELADKWGKDEDESLGLMPPQQERRRAMGGGACLLQIII